MAASMRSTASGMREKHLGQRITVEAIRSGFDRIDVEWIGAA